jgi:hypothetical protein
MRSLVLLWCVAAWLLSGGAETARCGHVLAQSVVTPLPPRGDWLEACAAPAGLPARHALEDEQRVIPAVIGPPDACQAVSARVATQTAVPPPPQWSVRYDNGFAVRPVDPQQNPFELKITGRVQCRHTAFARKVTQWRDRAGVVRPVTSENFFEVERARLAFEGFIIQRELQYFINLDADTDDNHVVIFHDVWVNYEFDEALNLYFGKAFVPGSRDWLNGALRMRMADRSMATTFFRPDRSVGIWAIGEPQPDWFYRVMIGNGFNTTDLAPDAMDAQFVYSGSMWWNLGDYGQGYSDLTWHATPAAQVGQSFTFASSRGRDPLGQPLAEENFVRLSDGTRLTQRGALAPGVQVDHFDIYLYTVDAAAKYAGWSINGEYFCRWLQSIRGDGPLPLAHFFDHGFYVEGGCFVVPQRLEINLRTSMVWGPFGNGREYAAGVNWFVNGTHNFKFTFDVTRLDNNPANNTGVNIRAGDDGWLFRSQFQAAF